MTYEKAIKLAISSLNKERRRYRQAYDKDSAGLPNQRAGARKYLMLDEAIFTLDMLKDECNDLATSVEFQELLELFKKGL